MGVCVCVRMLYFSNLEYVLHEHRSFKKIKKICYNLQNFITNCLLNFILPTLPDNSTNTKQMKLAKWKIKQFNFANYSDKMSFFLYISLSLSQDVMTVLISHLNYICAVIFHSSYVMKCHWGRVDTLCCVNGRWNTINNLSSTKQCLIYRIIMMHDIILKMNWSIRKHKIDIS